MAKEKAKEAEQLELDPHAGNLIFEAWEMRVQLSTESGTAVQKFEKLKMLRPRVKIRATEAQTLNTSLIHGDNRFVTMYLLPGEHDLLTIDEINYTPS